MTGGQKVAQVPVHASLPCSLVRWYSVMPFESTTIAPSFELCDTLRIGPPTASAVPTPAAASTTITSIRGANLFLIGAPWDREEVMSGYGRRPLPVSPAV